jgi:hypothetical protein
VHAAVCRRHRVISSVVIVAVTISKVAQPSTVRLSKTNNKNKIALITTLEAPFLY